MLVALFGTYSVIILVCGVITFRTVPEEAVALRQVQQRAHPTYTREQNIFAVAT